MNTAYTPHKLLHKFPLIAFDLDGTLADTESIAVPGAILVVKQLYGIDLTFEHWIANYHGMSGPPLLEKISAEFGVNMVWDDFFAARKARLPLDFANGVKPAPHMLEVVKTLHENGQPMAVCSNSMAERIALTLDVLAGQAEAGIRLPEVFGQHVYAAVGNPLLTPKPAPDVYLHAARIFNADPHTCVAVEDSVAGATAALAAGFITVGYVGLAFHPQADEARLKAAGVQYIMHSWDEFLGILERI